MKKFESFTSTFAQVVERIRLQPRIRDVIRERLSAYADMHAVPADNAKRFSFGQYISAYAFRAGFALMILVLGTGGIAYASQNTVPGNVLYSVKVEFVEPLESALLVDAKSRATWNAILAERRLSEATALALAGTLDETTRAYLEDRFMAYTARASAAAGEVRARGDVATSLALRSDLEARLTAHADLFSYLAEDEEVDGESRHLLAVVARARDEVAAERQQNETDASGRALAYHASDIDAAAHAADEVERFAKSSNASLSGSIEARLTAARASIASARTSLAQNEGGGAYVATQAATRLTHEAAILSKNSSIIALGASASVMSDPAAASPPSPEDPIFSITATTTNVEATTTDEKEEEQSSKVKEGGKDSFSDNASSPESKQEEQESLVESVKNLIGL